MSAHLGEVALYQVLCLRINPKTRLLHICHIPHRTGADLVIQEARQSEGEYACPWCGMHFPTTPPVHPLPPLPNPLGAGHTETSMTISLVGD